MIVTADQGYVFLTMVCTGILLGLLFDVFRGIRALVGAGRKLTLLLDLLYWLVSLVFCWLVLLEVTLGELRFYSLLALGVGMVWHFALFSPALVSAAQRLRARLQGTKRKDTRHSGMVLRGIARLFTNPAERIRDHFWGW